MKILKIAFIALALLTFSQSYGQKKKKNKLEETFKKFDTDSNSYLSYKEFKASFEGKTGKGGNPISEKKINKMFANKDTNGDKLLTMEEFKSKKNKR